MQRLRAYISQADENITGTSHLDHNVSLCRAQISCFIHDSVCFKSTDVIASLQFITLSFASAWFRKEKKEFTRLLTWSFKTRITFFHFTLSTILVYSIKHSCSYFKTSHTQLFIISHWSSSIVNENI
jgi:hypothetical protein